MTNNCPECGASMEFEQREVHLRTGVCPSCAKEFAFVEGATVSSRLGAPPSASGEEKEGEGIEASGVKGGPECEECGTPLTFRGGPRGSLEAICEECETTTVFVPKPGFSGGDRERSERPDEEAPRGRPCRRCGAPLRFTTGEDGLLVGECESCGNRFTLPPRPDRGGGRGFGRPPQYGRREFGGGRGGRPPFRGPRGDRRGRPYRSSDRRAAPRYDEDDRPRKRRRPREE